MAQKRLTPQVKICGLSRMDEALKCVELGADAIGLIFYPKSPRFISDSHARRICEALPSSTAKIGVFVDETFEAVMKKVEGCGLTGVQLHGKEAPDAVERFSKQGLIVIKGLFTRKSPALSDASRFNASAFLVECGKGKLPGGNAMTWNWSEAFEFGKNHPLILAGGLSQENIHQAISESLPDAVDVSSGVESSPGRKSMEKVSNFIETVRNAPDFYSQNNRRLKTIF